MPTSSGLGSSSSLIVGIIFGLSKMLRIKLSKKKIAKIAIFLAPIMPNISENILNKIGLSIKKLSMKDISNDNFLNMSYKIKKPEIIFQKIE